jgi:hypothetical protein
VVRVGAATPGRRACHSDSCGQHSTTATSRGSRGFKPPNFSLKPVSGLFALYGNYGLLYYSSPAVNAGRSVRPRTKSSHPRAQSGPIQDFPREYHPSSNGSNLSSLLMPTVLTDPQGTPGDRHGNFLPPRAPPTPPLKLNDNGTSFTSRAGFSGALAIYHGSAADRPGHGKPYPTYQGLSPLVPPMSSPTKENAPVCHLRAKPTGTPKPPLAALRMENPTQGEDVDHWLRYCQLHPRRRYLQGRSSRLLSPTSTRIHIPRTLLSSPVPPTPRPGLPLQIPPPSDAD